MELLIPLTGLLISRRIYISYFEPLHCYKYIFVFLFLVAMVLLRKPLRMRRLRYLLVFCYKFDYISWAIRLVSFALLLLVHLIGYNPKFAENSCIYGSSFRLIVLFVEHCLVWKFTISGTYAA